MSKFTIKQYYEGGNLIDNILRRSNISDKELYLNPDSQSLSSPYDYAMLEEGVDLLIEHMELDSETGILVDCDVDGYTSSAILYNTIQELDSRDITIIHQPGKQHGLNDEIVDKILRIDDDIGLDLLIIPDAGSNDHDERQKLQDIGITTLVIDHHEIEDETRLTGASKYTINNQRSDNNNSNENLVGAGVVLKFVEVLYQKYGISYINQGYDLAALGQIADMSDITDPEVRYIVEYGLRNINTELINTIVEERVQSLANDPQDELYPIDISFYVAPLINAVTRVGTQEEKELLFNCLTNRKLKDKYVVKRRRKTYGKFRTVELEWSKYEYVYDIISKVKNRQDNLVRRIEEDLAKDIEDDNGVATAILDSSEEGVENVTGLIANRLAARLGKPTLVLREDEDDDEILTGSGRGYKDSTITDFREFILGSNLAEFALGHANAMGSSFTRENLKRFSEYVSENVTEVEEDDTVVYVDKIETSINTTRVQYGHYLRALTNHNVDDVMYGYTNLSINPSFVRSNGSVTTIWERGLEFIIFNDYSEVGDWLREQKGFPKVDIVGKPTMNYWMGKGKPQIVVEQIQLS